MFLRLAVFVISFVFLGEVRSQAVNYAIYDTETGLPSSEVYSGFQSKNGILWFTSDRGVFTYNGYSFKTYTTNEGLGSNTCFAIFEGRDGSLWFTGYDGSLTYYDGIQFHIQKEISAYVKSRYKNDWIDFCDFGKDKIFFSLTKLKRQFEFDPGTGKIIESTWLYGPNPTNISRIGAHDYYRSSTHKINKSHPASDFLFSRIFRVTDAVSVFSLGNKVYRLSKHQGQTIITDSCDFHSFVQPKNIMVLDSVRGDFFVCSETGLYLCNFNTPGTIKQAILKNVNTNNIVADHEGNFWASTFNKGVIFIPSIDIKTYKETEIGNERIHSVLHINNTLIAGSASGILYFVEDKNLRQSEIDVNQKVPIEQLYNMRQDYILGYRAFKYRQNKWFLEDTSSAMFQRITPLDDNHIFFSRQNSIFIFDKENKRLLTEESPFNLIKSICYAQNRLWVGSITSLSSVEYQGNELVNYIDHSKAYPIFAQRVNDIKPFRNGILVSVFGKGLVYFDGKMPIPIHHEKIINQDLINRILVVNDALVLLLTNNGLVKIAFRNTRDFGIFNVELFDVNDGLSSNFINDAYLDNGMLWLATNKGVNCVRMESLNASATAPPVNIVALKTQDSTFRYAPFIRLNYSQNSFVVEFEGISFKKSNNFPFYKYCLVKNNQDTVWNYTNERFIQFTNLAPGEYVFLVSARNKNSGWAAHKYLKIFIAPHFTQTLWFRILGLLTIAFGIYLFIKVRIHNIKLKDEQQKKVELLGSKALEAELMALRNQMNPHFVFNSLNSIQRYIITNNFADANNYITRFSKLMRTSLGMSKLEFIGLDKEIEFISTYMDLEKMRFDNLFDYTIKVDDNIEEEMVQIPTLLIQPLLENSIKHGFKNQTEGGIIQIEITPFDTKHLTVVITDNGKGIEHLEDVLTEKQSKTSFGLGIVMQRIRLLKERTNDNKITFNLINIEQGVRATLIVPIQ